MGSCQRKVIPSWRAIFHREGPWKAVSKYELLNWRGHPSVHSIDSDFHAFFIPWRHILRSYDVIPKIEVSRMRIALKFVIFGAQKRTRESAGFEPSNFELIDRRPNQLSHHGRLTFSIFNWHFNQILVKSDLKKSFYLKTDKFNRVLQKDQFYKKQDRYGPVSRLL